MRLFLSALGLLLIFEGALYFAAPERMREAMAALSQAEPRMLRLAGGAALLLGMLVLYLGRLFFS
jgi:hypothetical protein